MTEVTTIDQPADGTGMVSMIERVVMDASLPIERLEKMLDLKERADAREDAMRAERARQDFNAALAACQAAMPVVGKNRTNDHTRSKYTDLAGVMDAVGPIIADHGFSLSFNPQAGDDASRIYVRWTLAHAGGHERTDIASFPIDAAGTGGRTNKTPIQAEHSSRTYARRYLVMDLFNIATTEDNDGNAAKAKASGPITKDQFIKIGELLEDKGLPADAVLTAERISNLTELDEEGAARVISKLTQTKKQGAA